jgi:hypothetical protein
MNVISRTTSRTSNTTLSLIGGHYTKRTTAAELQRVELELVHVMWRDCEGPDENVSRHLGRLVTEGRTLPEHSSHLVPQGATSLSASATPRN